jgi:DNA-binding MarR family transcriptional regulator
MPVTQQFEEALLDWSRVFMRRSMQESTHWMASEGLSRSQTGVLMHLHFHGNCPITTIGKQLDVSTPAASQLVDRLVHGGLVEREDDPEDGRVKQVMLSEAGSKLLKEGFQARLTWMQELGEFLPEQEQTMIAKSLIALVDAAAKTGKKRQRKIIIKKFKA